MRARRASRTRALFSVVPVRRRASAISSSSRARVVRILYHLLRTSSDASNDAMIRAAWLVISSLGLQGSARRLLGHALAVTATAVGWHFPCALDPLVSNDGIFKSLPGLERPRAGP